LFLTIGTYNFNQEITAPVAELLGIDQLIDDNVINCLIQPFDARDTPQSAVEG
jgi:hypothetical protein